MHHSGTSLSDFFDRYAQRGDALVLATIVATIGSTYRKPGAQMLIAADGSGAGLLSGGCLENDLVERARAVLASGEPALVDYDARGPDDVIWGIGLGCEGAMTILLTRIDPENGYQPFAYQEQCRRDDVPARYALVSRSTNARYPLGCSYFKAGVGAERAPLPQPVEQALAQADEPSDAIDRAVAIDAEDTTFLIVPVVLPLRLLVLGAGPDAMPLVEIAGLMNWHVTVFDHRAAYAVPERFPRAKRVAVAVASSLGEQIRGTRYDAAIVMSHHLPSDQAYLAALSESSIPYIGLLGPAPRRARLLREIGSRAAAALEHRLYGPVGLDIGARTPETIALAIIGEIQAVRAGRSGRSFSRVVPGAGAQV